MTDHDPRSHPIVHLSEELRQGAADGSLAADRLPEVEEHLRACESCVADVDRIRALMNRLRGDRSPSAAEPLDTLWPAIRSRIERHKVVHLDATASASGHRSVRRRVWVGIGLTAAAAVLIAILVPRVRSGGPPLAGPVGGGANAQSLIEAADSTRAYQQEARELLNRLELERTMLRPEAVSAIDHDLKIVDSAIAEVNAALARDPNNAALRQLLASTYRRKVDVLKRVGNAG